MGVGDSTPLETHPSGGMKKIERQRETRRRAAGMGEGGEEGQAARAREK